MNMIAILYVVELLRNFDSHSTRIFAGKFPNMLFAQNGILLRVCLIISALCKVVATLEFLFKL